MMARVVETICEALALATFLAAIALWADAARAHHAPTGWPYDEWCCSGFDCHPIPDAAVQIVDRGYLVTLTRGQHPLVGEPITQLVPFAKARPSGDEHYHACVFPAGTVRCLYVPPSGV